MQEESQWRCLEESDPFARINRQLRFLRKYWYVIAITPFALTVVVLVRFYGDSTNRLLDLPVYLALGWGLLVAVYTLMLMVRVMFIRCPQCGWRFGGGNRCGSCDFPRGAGSLAL